MKMIVFLLVVILLISACTPTYNIKSAFDVTKFEPYNKKGTGKVTGQAFLKTKGGDVKYGAGEEIKLVPSNSYTQEIWEAVRKGKTLENRDYRLGDYIRKTIADGSGHFIFESIPAGTYLIQCEVYWEIPSYYSTITTGETIIKSITVQEGKTTDVMVTETR
jgi:hypothetical protein